MKPLRLSLFALACALFAAGVQAQSPSYPPGSSQFNPPLPSPPPPPKIEVPKVPQMDAPLRHNYVPAAPRASFGDRITRCLDDAAAAGVKLSRRAAYSRACANRGD
jgi:hypothetical protein